MSLHISKQKEKYFYEHQATEQEFLEWYQQQDLPKYEQPSVTTDNVLFCYNKAEEQLKVLLIQRKTHPFQFSWALPGGFVQRNESTEDCCIRETMEETGLQIFPHNIRQLQTLSQPDRDPRGWVITVSYIAFIREEPLVAGDDAKKAVWFTIKKEENLLFLSDSYSTEIILDLNSGKSTGPNSLAFDHGIIIQKAFQVVESEMYHNPRVLQILGDTFTITEARKVFATFMGINYKKIDHSNFKKNIQQHLIEVGERPNGIGRPSKFYRLKK